MGNHQWRLSQAYTYALYISKYISITSFLIILFSYCMSIFFYYMFYVFGISFIYTFSVFLFRVLYIFLYLSCVHLSRLLYVFSMFLFFVKLHSLSLVYVFFIFRFYDLLHSSLSYLYYCILSYYMCSSCTFHILLSCTIPILHIHLYVLILSIIYFVLSYTFCGLEVPVGTTEINPRYIQIFTFILCSESYHISV